MLWSSKPAKRVRFSQSAPMWSNSIVEWLAVNERVTGASPVSTATIFLTSGRWYKKETMNRIVPYQRQLQSDELFSIPESSNGRTCDFESQNRGSRPCSGTNYGTIAEVV